MDAEYGQVMDIVAENPGATIEEIMELAADRDVADIHDVADMDTRMSSQWRSATTISSNLTTGTG